MNNDKSFKHIQEGIIKATVLFIDIKNFFEISEKLNPKQTGEFVIRITRPLVACVHDHLGYVCQVQGDALLAVFGNASAPSASHHAHRAVRCALDMQHIVSELNPVMIEDIPITFSAGVGICCGEMYACFVETSIKKDFTVMGKTVNLASRLQKLNRHYNTNILIDEAVYSYIRDDVSTRKLDKLKIKGCKRNIRAYKVLSPSKKGGQKNIERSEEKRQEPSVSQNENEHMS